ncbi:MAG: response regulator [bacterium]|nr:response regulator [bacterium]
MIYIPKEHSSVLIVDDDPGICEFLRSALQNFGHQPQIVQSGEEAIFSLNRDYDLILLDLDLPVLSGFEVLKFIRSNQKYKHIPVIVITGDSDRSSRIDAIRFGANDFINKPIDLIELQVRIKSQLNLKQAVDEIKFHKENLEILVEQRTTGMLNLLREVQNQQEKVHFSYLDTIKTLALSAEFYDKTTAAHIRRMSMYSELLARKLGLPDKDIQIITHASALHDIGKIATPHSILTKTGTLTEDEWKIMQKHTIAGYEMLNHSLSDYLQVGSQIALTHHEKWDGSGYPHKLQGSEIPIWGRICAIADVFDALTSVRPYKRAFSNEEALQLIEQQSGKHFDPQLVKVLLSVQKELSQIQEKTLKFQKIDSL